MNHGFDSRKKAQKENIKVALNIRADGLVSRAPCLVTRLPQQVVSMGSSDEPRATSDDTSGVINRRKTQFAYAAVNR